VGATLAHARADVNVRGPGGMSPLHWCASEGHVGVARALLQASADPLQETSAGFTFLDTAALSQPAYIVQRLRSLLDGDPLLAEGANAGRISGALQSRAAIGNPFAKGEHMDAENERRRCARSLADQCYQELPCGGCGK
jgi:ankyrin repeat protein